jgi:hypothetical protein
MLSGMAVAEEVLDSQTNALAREDLEQTPVAECHVMGGVLEQECAALFRAAKGDRPDSNHESQY